MSYSILEMPVLLLKTFLEREHWKCINNDKRSGVYAFTRFDFKDYRVFVYTEPDGEIVNKIILFFGLEKWQPFNYTKFETFTDLIEDIEIKMKRGYFNFEMFYDLENHMEM
jgi:hypothetical protein